MTKICYYGDKISQHISKTPEGFLICQSVPIARTGYQQYLDSEINDDGDPDEIVDVYRAPKEVFSRATLASFEGKPVTNDHPDVDVTPENYCELACGHAQHVRVGEGEDSDKILADLYITDPNLINAIMNGKREVSAGYYAEDQVDGHGRVCQINIRGNHIAVVDNGRAGKTVCIRDAQMKTNKMGVKTMKLSLLKKMRRYLLDAEPEEMSARADKVQAMIDDEDLDAYVDSDDLISDEDFIVEDEDMDMIEDEDELDLVEDEDDVDMIEDEDELDIIEDEDDVEEFADSCKKRDSRRRDACKKDEDKLDLVEDEDDVDMIEDEDELDIIEDEDDLNEDEDEDMIAVDVMDEDATETKDAALRKLQKIAGRISNRRDRAMMQSAIIDARGHKSQMPGVMKHVRNAQKKRDAGYIDVNISKQQNVYDSLNPHKK